MKKKICCLVLILMAALAASGALASSTSWTTRTSSDHQWQYGVNVYGQAWVYQYLGSGASLTIPQRIDGYTVVEISSGIITESLTSLTINAELTSVGPSLFTASGSLKYVTLGSSIKTIEKDTFSKTYGLVRLSASGVTTVGDGAFSGCEELTSATFGSSLESLGASAFSGCRSLTAFTAPTSLKTIGAKAFEGCEKLKSVTLKGPVTIGTRAFADLQALETVTFNAAPAKIGAYAFSGCAGITALSFPDGPTVIDEHAFEACAGLESLTLPEGLTSLGTWAFQNCAKLTELTLPSTVASIGSYALPAATTKLTLAEGLQVIGPGWFSDMPNLAAVSIPKSVREIGPSAFSECTALERVDLPDGLVSIGDAAFAECAALGSVAIPDSVQEIGERAFSQCGALSGVTFGAGLRSIGPSAFYGCHALTRVELPTSLETFGVKPGESAVLQGNVFLETGVTRLTIPEGVTAVGGNFDQKIVFLPRSLERVEGTFRYATAVDLVIYCYQGSFADQYAQDNQIDLRYVDVEPFSRIGEVTVEPIVMNVGQAVPVRYTAFPDLREDVSYTTTNRNICYVSEDGVVHGVGRGTAWIGVKIGDYNAHAKVRVRLPITSLSVEDWYHVEGDGSTFKFSYEPANADVEFEYLAGGVIIPEHYETIDENGNVIDSGTRVVGYKYTVGVRDLVSGLSAEAREYRCDPVSAISLSAYSLDMAARDTGRLTATVTSGSETYTNRLVTFASSDSAVVSVDEEGRLIARRPGEATITVSASGGVSASCAVRVTDTVQLRVPEGVTTIENSAFAGDTFASIYLPDSVRTIESRAFAANVHLEKIYLPAELDYIASDALAQCFSAVIVTRENSATAVWAKRHGFAVQADPTR